MVIDFKAKHPDSSQQGQKGLESRILELEMKLKDTISQNEYLSASLRKESQGV